MLNLLKLQKLVFMKAWCISVEMTQKQLTINYDKQFIQMDLNNYDFFKHLFC